MFSLVATRSSFSSKPQFWVQAGPVAQPGPHSLSWAPSRARSSARGPDLFKISSFLLKEQHFLGGAQAGPGAQLGVQVCSKNSSFLLENSLVGAQAGPGPRTRRRARSPWRQPERTRGLRSGAACDSSGAATRQICDSLPARVRQPRPMRQHGNRMRVPLTLSLDLRVPSRRLCSLGSLPALVLVQNLSFGSKQGL